jgi:hypothetical protein
MATTPDVRLTRCAGGVVLLVWALAGPAPLASDAAIAVDVRPSVIYAGGTVRTTIRTPRDPRNRTMRIVLEAADYYASSEVQLDGAGAPAVYQFEWQTLPSGSYSVEAILTREAGDERRARRCLSVLGGDSSDSGSRASHRAPSSDAQPGGC